MSDTTLHIGCSGFYYKDWKGLFYPDGLPQRAWLRYYAREFDTVEINSSFYSLPRVTTLDRWYDETPENFIFTLKGNRIITHDKRLIDVAEEVATFYKLAGLLKEKLGTILWQLPGSIHRDDEKLERFCALLSNDFTNVIEFRHRSWFDEGVYETLSRYNVSLCIISAPRNLPEDLRTTTDTAYVRFHGKTRWYRYLYNTEELAMWSERIKQLDARRIFVYFNNDYDANAIANAKELMQLLNV